MIVLAELTPLNPVTGLRETLRASSANDSRVTGLNDLIWQPAIAEPPVIGIRLFKGDFDGSIAPNGGSLSIKIDRYMRTNPAARGFIWQGARIKLWAGSLGQAWPWTQVFEGIVDGDSFTAQGNKVDLNIKSDTSPFEKDALTLKYLGTGGIEGGDGLKGQVKPFLLGRCSNVEPVLIDAVNNVYQFSGYGPIQAVNVLYERGNAFGASTGNFATYAALVAATIPNGGWGTCLASGLIRLGAPQYGVITGDVDGDAFGGTWRRKTGEIVQRIASNAGISGTLIDSASWNALDTALLSLTNQGRIGYFMDSQRTVLDVAAELAAPCNSQAGVSLLGKLFACRMVIGAGSLTLDAQQRQLPRVTSSEETGVSPPFSYIQFGYDRAWRVHTSDEIAFVAITDGAPGPAGLSNATVFAFQRSATPPTNPSVSATYTFATGALTGLNNGWSATVPASNGNPLYVIAATASSTGASDTIASGEWSAAVIQAQDGGNGTNGLSTASVYLYQRNDTGIAPAVPSASLTYTFSTALLSGGSLAGWTQTVPPSSGGRYIFITTATALSTGSTDTITTGEWATVQILAQNGTDGAPGVGIDGTTFYTWYAYSDAANGTFNFTTGFPGDRTYQGIATNKTTATESTNPADYAWSPYIGPPNFGLAAFNSNTTVSGNKLIKVAGGAAWNASIHSTESYKSGASVSFIVDSAGSAFMVGLNTDPTTDASFASIDFAAYVAGGGGLQVYESGGFVFPDGPIAINGDVITVTYNNKTVVYSRNGIPFYTNNSPAADLNLFLDSSINSDNIQAARIISFTGVGSAGVNGTNGLNNATVFAFRRSAGVPANPSGTATYTFATGTLTGLNNGWSPTVPTSDGNPLYVIAATASSTGASDTIAGGEWSSPVIQAQDGTGSNGLNYASVYLYQRNNTGIAPAVPTDTLTYTFTTTLLSGGSLAGWSRSVPAASGGDYLFVTTGTALSTTNTDIITSGEWAAVQILAQDGSDGISPVSAVASPANKQFTADSGGTVKTGQLPFTVGVSGTKAGASISGTITILSTVGCTATATSTGFTIDTVFADAGFVEWRFTASDAQVVENRMSFSRQRDPASGGAVTVNFTSDTWWGSGSYAANGPSTVLAASSTGKLRIDASGTFYTATANGNATITAKLQYRLVGSGTWIDSGFTSTGISIKLTGIPGEPDENSPGEVAPGGLLTGLTANGSYEIQMVGTRSGATANNSSGFVSMRQEA